MATSTRRSIRVRKSPYHNPQTQKHQSRNVSVRRANENDYWRVVQYLQDQYLKASSKDATPQQHDNAFFWDSIPQISIGHFDTETLFVIGPKTRNCDKRPLLPVDRYVYGYMLFDKSTGYLEILDVFNTHRKCGYGRKLVEFAELECKKQDNPDIEFHFKTLAEATGFWQRLGFQSTIPNTVVSGAIWTR
jgi:GNAT superfamily N-acetyltransferase